MTRKRLVTFDELKPLKGISGSRQTIWRMVRAKKFPKPVKHGARNAWLESDLDDYIDKIAAKRDGK